MGLLALALAAPPEQAAVQGTLRSQGGAAVDGTYSLSFRLYDAQTGGALLKEFDAQDVEVADGVFTAAMGGVGPDLLQSAEALWVAVKVEGEPELDRVLLQSTPLAILASRSLDLACSGCVTKQHLSAGLLDGFALASDIANASKWDEAYGWGNHALAGYLKGGDDLELAGTLKALSVQIGNDPADCDAAKAGTLRWDGSVVQVCDGEKWVAVYSPPVVISSVDIKTGAAGQTVTVIGSAFVVGDTTVTLGGQPLVIANLTETSFTYVSPFTTLNQGQALVVVVGAKSATLPNAWTRTTAATKVFAYTGDEQSWTVPPGVTSVSVKLWGGGGAGKWSTSHSYGSYIAGGGGGGYSTGLVAVSPGEALTVVVAQGGQFLGGGGWSTVGAGGDGGGACSGSCKGGGGGGATGVRRAASTLIVAGGGGGGGNGGGGGGGGGLSGGKVETIYKSACGAGDGLPHYGGAGGTQSAPGEGGWCSDCGFHQSQGAPGVGGDGGNGETAGHVYPTGGGGGGYFGGGGGGNDSTGGGCNAHDTGGGGGGGSGYTGGATAVSMQTGDNGVSGADTAGGAANDDDPAYAAGVGAGGKIGVNGGNGLAVISY